MMCTCGWQVLQAVTSFVYLFIYLYLSIYLFVYLCLSKSLALRRSVCPSVWLAGALSVRLFVSLSILVYSL